MQLKEKQTLSSWSKGASPLILSDIFSNNVSVTVWHRKIDTTISQYFDKAFESLGLGVRGVFSMDSLKQELSNTLPEYEGKRESIDDIYLLSDMLTCLFDCDTVGLRIAPLTTAMCPSFHVDNIPVRLVNTYLGSGTQWLPLECLHEHPPSDENGVIAKTNFGLHYNKQHIQQMNTFDVGLLKGKAWHKQNDIAAVHRSCQLAENEKRVLLTLDPM